jgi:hypothetical protein
MNHEGVLVHANAQLIAGLDLLRGLGSLTVDFDVTTVDRVGCDRSRFVEARGPEPFVDAHSGNVAEPVFRPNPF